MAGEVHLFGVRHHGPGSARSVIQALDALKPDVLLVEGPPDAESVLPLVIHAHMQPPVALLLYATQNPKKAAYYPMATFSPEWQAVRYALLASIPVRFMDLPQCHQLAMIEEQNEQAPDEHDSTHQQAVHLDPLGELAKAAGFPDGERWWEHTVEHRRDNEDIFIAVQEAMIALREQDLVHMSAQVLQHEIQREAYMRSIIRSTQKQNYRRIAVVCGAWHTPALASPENHADQDEAILANLPSIAITATWIPWTNSRLTMVSGYGAGIWSPGWYQHLWECEGDIGINWLTKAAHLLRGEDLTASTAQIIDAARLAESLAALRGLALPGLAEFNEAVRSVYCFGSEKPLELIARKLIVGETIGSVPDNTPMVPLHHDLRREQKRLNLRPDDGETTLNLDLRVQQHLERSHLLHRLLLLDIAWGTKIEAAGKGGTFREIWDLRWQPELTIRLIERSAWGNTIADAASAYTHHRAQETKELLALTGLIGDVLLADLPEAAEFVSQRLQEISALTTDFKALMAGLPALVDVLCYGNVRQTGEGMLRLVIDVIAVRIWVNLAGACTLLADDAASEMFKLICAVNIALRLFENAEYLNSWHHALGNILEDTAVHGLISGRCCRILFDADVFKAEDIGRVMSLEMSPASEPMRSSAWLEGFLRDSGMVLLYDKALLKIIDDWVRSLSDDTFIMLLPLLRRTFSSFTEPERRKIGQLLRGKTKNEGAIPLDEARAKLPLPLIALILGIEERP
ncbi:MAG: DUF5682 family protein [Chloroflexota bacterium]